MEAKKKMNIVEVHSGKSGIMNWSQNDFTIKQAEKKGLGKKAVTNGVENLEEVKDTAKEKQLNGLATGNSGVKNFKLLNGHKINLEV